MYRQLSASIVGQTYTAGILTISNMYIVPNQQTTLCFFPTRHFSLQERIIWMKELYISHTGQHIRYVWTISIWLNFMVGFSGSFLGLYPAVNMLLFQVVFNPWNPLKVWDHGSRLPNIGTWIEGPGEREREIPSNIISPHHIVMNITMNIPIISYDLYTTGFQTPKRCVFSCIFSSIFQGEPWIQIATCGLDEWWRSAFVDGWIIPCHAYGKKV